LVRVVNLPRSIPDLTLLPTPIAPVKTPRKSFPGKHLQSGVNDITDPVQIAAMVNRKQNFYTELTVYPYLRISATLNRACWTRLVG